MKSTRVSINRKAFTQSSRNLKRARRLYIRLCTPAILASTDDSVVHQVAKNMINSGLYASTTSVNWHDMRYRIARMMFNLERGSFGSTQVGEFSFWLTRNGFGQNFRRSRKIQTA
jgi:hypothetical protein